MLKYTKELSNKNKLQTESTCEANYVKEADGQVFKWVFSGREECAVGNRTLSVHPDSFLILNQGSKYTEKIDSITPVNTLTIGFNQAFITDFNNSNQCTIDALLCNEGKETEQPQFMEAIYPFTGDMRFNILHLKAQIDQGVSDELLINEYLHHCLLNYYKIYKKEVLATAEKLSFAKTKTRTEVLKRLSVAKDYIISNYDKNFSLEDVASAACLSVNHLLRTFKEAYNDSPHQYLTNVRLSRAKYLLRTSNCHINEIVSLVGFECPSSFIRLFKTKFKITPINYKKNRLN
ncbi:helix-turn-helix domain-containing protein [Pedobacter sp. LMG 31464]|uniref:Helix-turn-helix domain-containing protein n=1 Tax=Pedobacter planticolens TaxID=2679964 RepID=A0A923E1B4_9SPHI|nr:AraC family transcriptional regulator [Pedobacter planticolens]MBB2146253.1 helix-turn-helix domain-containing protein [Pedobacter planticolens]